MSFNLKNVIVFITLSTIIGYLGVKDSFNPQKRVDIKQKIFTIGDINYNEALKKDKNIIKFGPMFWGLYPGGLAFSNVEDAKAFILKNKNNLNNISSQWAVYELSGDFALDTVKIKNQHYIKSSLLIKKLVFMPNQSLDKL